MTRGKPQIARVAYLGVYFFMFILVFWPVADLVTNTWPTQLGNVQWRYGFMGLLSGFLHTPILGLMIAMITALSLGHRRVLRSLSGVCLAGAVLLGLVVLFFALDVVQVRAMRPAGQLSSFTAGALIAELKHVTAFVALSLLGFGGWKTAGALSGDASAKADPGLVMDPKQRGSKGAKQR